MTTYPRIIAHRCGGALVPENSLAGLLAAARLGCRAVEFDVMLTADRVPVLIHDETLERTFGRPGRVADLSCRELRALAPGLPTLAEALDVCREYALWCNIELKPATGVEEETGAVVGAWLAGHWDGHGIVSSFSEKSALAGRHYLPEAAFALLYETLPPDWDLACVALRATGVHLAVEAVDARSIAALVKAGMPWACYTVNDRVTAERLFADGCTAVFTDRPDLWQGGKA